MLSWNLKEQKWRWSRDLPRGRPPKNKWSFLILFVLWIMYWLCRLESWIYWKRNYDSFFWGEKRIVGFNRLGIFLYYWKMIIIEMRTRLIWTPVVLLSHHVCLINQRLVEVQLSFSKYDFMLRLMNNKLCLACICKFTLWVIIQFSYLVKLFN